MDSFREEVLNYYTEHHTVKETCERFGIGKYKLEYWVKAAGVTNGRTVSEINAQKARSAASKTLKRREAEFIRKTEVCGFDYLGGFISTDKGLITVRCKKCGIITQRGPGQIYKGKAVCLNCKRKERNERQAAEKRQKQLDKEKREAEQAEKQEAKRKENENRFNATYICKECGREYTPLQYMRSRGLKIYSNPGFCSGECGKRYARRKTRNNQKERGTYKKDTHRKRCRQFGCPYDSSVTLKNLIKRDGLFCSICGLACNPEDKGWTKYLGPMSPTIDHIIPLAQKGSPGHVWSNVQVAHAICNSYKADKVRREDGKYETNKQSRRSKKCA